MANVMAAQFKADQMEEINLGKGQTMDGSHCKAMSDEPIYVVAASIQTFTIQFMLSIHSIVYSMKCCSD